MQCCDDLSGHVDTYANNALNQSSCIDHLFVNAALRSLIADVSVVDCVVNHSDYKPLVCKFKSLLDGSKREGGGNSKRPRLFHTRWDKANLSEFYKASYDLLSDVSVVDTFASCPEGCSVGGHRAAIDRAYNVIVHALQQAEVLTVPRIPQKSLKPFWNEYLDELKEKSVFWGRLWKDATVFLDRVNYVVLNPRVL
jgi:hypothetical protein